MKLYCSGEQEREFKSKLTRLLYQPPTATYASTSGGTAEGIDYYEWMKQILALIKESLPELAKEAGYRQISGKAPLLTASDIEVIWKQLSMKPLPTAIFRFAGEVILAQLDVADRHYGGKA